MPIIQSFLLAAIFIFLEINVEKDLRITGKFLATLKTMANPFIMIFIGMKVELPSFNELQLFTPIFARRTFSLFIMIVTQLLIKLDKNEFITNIVFSMSADSIWPYVHLMALYDSEHVKKKNKYL